ncbi:hypothetical protein, partial [Dactylosporangium sucinum]
MRRSGETDDAPARVVGLPPDPDDALDYPWDATFRAAPFRAVPGGGGPAAFPVDPDAASRGGGGG